MISRFTFRAFFLSFFISFSFLSLFAQPKNISRVRTFDVQHYIIRASFDRRTKTVFGDTTIKLKPLDRNFTTVTLDAAGMKYEVVRLETGSNLKYRQQGEKLIITLDKAYSPDDLISLRISYSCQPKKGVYFVDRELEGKKVLHEPQIWTHHEPEEAHFWFPSYDFPDDKATSEQMLTVNADETVIANGELVQTMENSDGTKTVHYKTDFPHPTYLTSFVVGKYVKLEDKYNSIPLGFYVYPGKESIVPKVFGKTKEMFEVFENLTGIPFQFNKYDQTIVAKFNFGGMENITATTLADEEVFAYPYLPREVEDLISHELAHSWFGNLATCKNWSELWLNEGFATFMEAAFREKHYGHNDYLKKVLSDSQRFLAEDATSKNRHALFNTSAKPDDSIFDATTYQKGGAVIHTLREEIGDAAFWKGVNIYLTRNKFGNVETKDLQNAMEESSKRDLDWFFRQWVYREGYPKLEMKQIYSEKQKKLKLDFQQLNAESGVYNLPLDIEIDTTEGKIFKKIIFDKRSKNFSFDVPHKPVRIRIDPKLKIPLITIKIIPLQISDKNLKTG